MKNTFAILCVLAASFTASDLGRASAQETIEFPKASPPSYVRTQVGLTTVEIEYGRPSVRDRKIFGGLIPYGEVWRTGANEATKITFSTDVTFGGKAVPAGSYALFTIPGEKEWTVILNKATGLWGSYQYDKANDLARVTAKKRELARPIESFTIDLHHLRDDSAYLSLMWENTSVAVKIETDIVAMLVPKIEEVMAGEGDNKPYLAAAMFYYAHDVDLSKAIEWIDMAAQQQPEAVWIQYRKGLILAKAGDTKAAMEAAKTTIELASKMGGELGAEYKRLGEMLAARLN